MRRWRSASATSSDRAGPHSVRRLRFTLVALLTLVGSAPSLMAQRAPPRKLAASLERVYGPGVRADTVPMDPEVTLRIYRGDSLLGFAQVGNVKGKDQPITFLVATATALRLKDIDILVYREPYGGEVAYEQWRRQFRGTRPGDSLEVDRQIRGISGATISVHAVTAAVRHSLENLAAWHKDGRL